MQCKLLLLLLSKRREGKRASERARERLVRIANSEEAREGGWGRARKRSLFVFFTCLLTHQVSSISWFWHKKKEEEEEEAKGYRKRKRRNRGKIKALQKHQRDKKNRGSEGKTKSTSIVRPIVTLCTIIKNNNNIFVEAGTFRKE